jgi:putative hydroxymethylpyrimidine transport system substrate-binding protein
MAYFPREVLAESLRLIAPTWTHDGRWGVQRDELLGPYATWLAEHGVLRSERALVGATTNDLLAR